MGSSVLISLRESLKKGRFFRGLGPYYVACIKSLSGRFLRGPSSVQGFVVRMKGLGFRVLGSDGSFWVGVLRSLTKPRGRFQFRAAFRSVGLGIWVDLTLKPIPKP